MAVLLLTGDTASAQTGTVAPVPAEATDVPPGAFKAGHITLSKTQLSLGKRAADVLAVINVGAQGSLSDQVPVSHCAAKALRSPSPGLRYEGPLDVAVERLVTAINQEEWLEPRGMLQGKVNDAHVLKAKVTVYPGKGAAIDDVATLLAQLNDVGMTIQMGSLASATTCNLILFASDGYAFTYRLRSDDPHQRPGSAALWIGTAG